jgi:hypothetical protein
MSNPAGDKIGRVDVLVFSDLFWWYGHLHKNCAHKKGDAGFFKLLFIARLPCCDVSLLANLPCFCVSETALATSGI